MPMLLIFFSSVLFTHSQPARNERSSSKWAREQQTPCGFKNTQISFLPFFRFARFSLSSVIHFRATHHCQGCCWAADEWNIFQRNWIFLPYLAESSAHCHVAKLAVFCLMRDYAQLRERNKEEKKRVVKANFQPAKLHGSPRALFMLKLTLKLPLPIRWWCELS